MAADLATFIQPVVASSCRMLQLTDPEDQTQFLESDEMVEVCARLAYSQLCSFCRRSFLKDDFEEYYLDEEAKINLKNFPIFEITDVYLVYNRLVNGVRELTISDTPLVVDVDYKLTKNKFLNMIGMLPSSFDLYSKLFVSPTYGLTTCINRKINVWVQYTGGFDYADEDEFIFEALRIQTIANWQAKDLLGVKRSANRNSNAYAVESAVGGGVLIEGAQQVIAPYVYYGMAEEG